MFQLHVVCHTLTARKVEAVHRLASARDKLKLHLRMACLKGNPIDIGAWDGPIEDLQGFDLLFGKILVDLQVMEAAGDTMLWYRQPPAPAQQPPATGLASAAAVSLSQQEAHTGNQPSGEVAAGHATAKNVHDFIVALGAFKGDPKVMDVDLNPTDHPDLFTTSEAGNVVMKDQPVSYIAAYLMDATPAELRSDQTVHQLLEPGYPRSLACSGCLTMPQPASLPCDINSPYSLLRDSDLIVWDPDENTATWIHPRLHLRGCLLTDFAAAYPSAEVLVETDVDEHGRSAGNKTGIATIKQHVLANLPYHSVPSFATAGTIDIMYPSARSSAARRGSFSEMDQSLWNQLAVPRAWMRRPCSSSKRAT